MWISALAAFAVLVGAGLVGVGMTRVRHGGTTPVAGLFSDASSPTPSPSPTGPSPEEIAARRYAAATKSLTGALAAYAKTGPDFSVAVYDRKTGQTYAYGGTKRYETASVVKVQVLACLLLTAQDDDRDLTSNELALAQRMIRASDNNATTSLFQHLGSQSAVSRSNKRLGLTSTTVNGSWGLTRTTVTDQVKLLNQLVDPKSPLTSKSRKLAFDLMSTVEPDQDWGVPSVAAKGETATVKNGWLPRSTEGNRWIINTVGRVTGGGTDVSIAVLSHDNASMSSGIKVVEKVAQTTRQYLKY